MVARPPEGTGEYRVPGADGDAFVFRYQIVPLWQLDAREMQAELGPCGAPFCAAMRGADEAFIRELVAEVQIDPSLAPVDRRSTIQLLYIVSAVMLGSDGQEDFSRGIDHPGSQRPGTYPRVGGQRPC